MLCRPSAVFLDAGNTLLYANPPVAARYAAAGQRHGLDVTPVQIKQVYEPLWQQFHGQRAQHLFRTTPASTRDFWRTFVAAIFAPWRDRIDDFEAMFGELYDGFAASAAWRSSPTGTTGSTASSTSKASPIFSTRS